MQSWCDGKSTQEALGLLESARIPAAPVLSLQQTLEDTHISANRLFEPVDVPGGRAPAPLTATPVKLSATPGTIRSVAPGIGEHTDEVLASLGYDMDEIAELRASGAV